MSFHNSEVSRLLIDSYKGKEEFINIIGEKYTSLFSIKDYAIFWYICGDSLEKIRKNVLKTDIIGEFLVYTSIYIGKLNITKFFREECTLAKEYSDDTSLSISIEKCDIYFTSYFLKCGAKISNVEDISLLSCYNSEKTKNDVTFIKFLLWNGLTKDRLDGYASFRILDENKKYILLAHKYKCKYLFDKNIIKLIYKF